MNFYLKMMLREIETRAPGYNYGKLIIMLKKIL